MIQAQPGTVSTRTEQVRRYVQMLIAGIRGGRAEEVYRRFYSAQAKCIEAWQREYPRPISGVATREFVGDQVQVHEAFAVRVLVDGDTSMIEWRVLASANKGPRKDEVIPIRQVWIQTWSGDRIIEEEYYAP
jgi:hypothetical protein